MKRMFLLGMLAWALACSASDRPVPAPGSPAELSLSRIEDGGSPTSLTVRAAWSASTVPTPNGPITYDLLWVRNGAQIRTLNGTLALADTITFARAPIGSADTVDFSVRSSYFGRSSAWATIRKIYPNADNQVPSIPVIVTVDTL